MKIKNPSPHLWVELHVRSGKILRSMYLWVSLTSTTVDRLQLLPSPWKKNIVRYQPKAFDMNSPRECPVQRNCPDENHKIDTPTGFTTKTFRLTVFSSTPSDIPTLTIISRWIGWSTLRKFQGKTHRRLHILELVKLSSFSGPCG